VVVEAATRPGPEKTLFRGPVARRSRAHASSAFGGGLPERNLDVLRALAVLLVLGSHVAAMRISTPSAAQLVSDLGQEGVVLFFVHTALVLMASLERIAARGLSGWGRARDFYIRRAFRIYPLAIFTVMIVVATHTPVHPAPVFASPFEPPTLGRWLANLTLTTNLFNSKPVSGPLWSLPLEVQMYVALPLAFALIIRAPALRAVGIFCLGIALGAVALRIGPPLQAVQYAPCFMAGVMAFWLLRRVRARLPGWIWWFVLLLLVWLSHIVLPGLASDPSRGWALAIVVGVAIPFVRNLGDSMFVRAAHVVCTYSYSIYLIHLPLLAWTLLRMNGAPLWARYAAFTAGIIVIPALLYHLLEEPMIRLGARVASGFSRTWSNPEGLASSAPAP
jgi:peptidoglycan/LPS O-acetylase OafA/YrhL